MNKQYKYKPTKPKPATAHSGTFPFFQPPKATALKNTKEPKFSNRTPAADNSVLNLINTLKYFDSS